MLRPLPTTARGKPSFRSRAAPPGREGRRGGHPCSTIAPGGVPRDVPGRKSPEERRLAPTRRWQYVGTVEARGDRRPVGHDTIRLGDESGSAAAETDRQPTTVRRREALSSDNIILQFSNLIRRSAPPPVPAPPFATCATPTTSHEGYSDADGGVVCRLRRSRSQPGKHQWRHRSNAVRADRRLPPAPGRRGDG